MKTINLNTDLDVEQHVAEHNRFFQLTHYTLDDLDVYADPFSSSLQAIYSASEGSRTDQQLIDAVRQAVECLKAIHAAMELKYAA